MLPKKPQILKPTVVKSSLKSILLVGAPFGQSTFFIDVGDLIEIPKDNPRQINLVVEGFQKFLGA